ncbi:MAG: DNA adenine methylase [Novosphingobium sp.]|nr:DNA adenine methylase [Novosphingobium sp.]
MKEELSEAVRPVRPVAPYIGGKRALAKRLVALIDGQPHDLYAEPFVGMGGIFFRRTRRPRKEVINDISTDVVNLFRLLQRHYQQLLDVLKWQVCSRAEFERLVGLDPSRLTDLERAVRFLYLQRTSFGGKVQGQHFGIARTNPARFDLTKLVPMLEDVHERLCGVDIERLPYAELIARYDTPGTLFYLDPPYFGCETDYGPGVFSEADFERLRALLEGLQGRFIMSINDTPEIRSIFSGFAFEEVGLNYRVGGRVTPARELIVSAA